MNIVLNKSILIKIILENIHKIINDRLVCKSSNIKGKET